MFSNYLKKFTILVNWVCDHKTGKIVYLAILVAVIMIGV